jgi:hypothetical protein
MDQRTRKQVYLLSAQDLTDQLIWEFCPDEEDVEGQDEATVRPSTNEEVPGYSPGVYIFAANVRFADGTTGIGYLYSGKPDDFGMIQPNVVTDAGQVNFWLGWLQFRNNLEQHLSQAYELIGKDCNSIFPISFESKALVNGASQKIIVESFMGMDKGQLVRRS